MQEGKESDIFSIPRKGTKQIHRSPRKRGGKARQRGINNEQVAAMGTTDRVSEIDMTVARDRKIEHYAIRADLKQHVKKKVYHVQHVNSIDSRMKKWIEGNFWK